MTRVVMPRVMMSRLMTRVTMNRVTTSRVTMTRLMIIACVVMIGWSTPLAAVDTLEPPRHDWSFEGPLGTYDRPSVQRGLQVYEEVCSACHSLKYVHYRDLAGIGYNAAQIKAIASEKTVTFIDDKGESAERDAKAADQFVSPFPNDGQARVANGGAFPPDLSLIVKARRGGADYIAALLYEGYQEAPADFDLMEGRYYNTFFSAHQIAMPPPLFDDMVEYADGTAATVQQMSVDVTAFLAWAADPSMEERKNLGFNILIFLVVLSFLLYLVKRKIWMRLE